MYLLYISLIKCVVFFQLLCEKKRSEILSVPTLKSIYQPTDLFLISLFVRNPKRSEADSHLTGSLLPEYYIMLKVSRDHNICWPCYFHIHIYLIYCCFQPVKQYNFPVLSKYLAIILIMYVNQPTRIKSF